jgi:hypothetical protein
VLEGADEEIVEPLVVREWGARQRLAAAPAADEMEQAVHPAEPLGESGTPAAGGVRIQQVDDAVVDALVGEAELGCQLLEPIGGDVGERQRGARVGEATRHERAQAAARSRDGDRPPVEARVAHAADASGAAGDPSPSAGRRSASSSLDWSCT